MAKSRKLGVLSLAKLLAGLMAFVGLIAGISYSFGGATIDVLVSKGWITSASTPGVGWGTALAFLALIAMPSIFATFGLIAGATGAFLNNLVAGRVSGLDDKGNGPSDLTRTHWGVSIAGGATVGAIVGAIVGALNDGIEAAYGGGLFGALIGGGFFGSVLGIVWHGTRTPNLPDSAPGRSPS